MGSMKCVRAIPKPLRQQMRMPGLCFALCAATSINSGPEATTPYPYAPILVLHVNQTIKKPTLAISNTQENLSTRTTILSPTQNAPNAETGWYSPQITFQATSLSDCKECPHGVVVHNPNFPTSKTTDSYLWCNTTHSSDVSEPWNFYPTSQ